MIDRRPGVYTDENVRQRLIEGLRERDFDVLTAGEVGRLGDDDEAHLALAASLERVLLTFDRGDFRRLHARFVDAGRTHAGIALLYPSVGARRASVSAKPPPPSSRVI